MTMTEKFIPLNDLEKLLIQTQVQTRNFNDFLTAFMKSDLCVPSASEIQADGSGFVPLLFDKQGTQMLSAFTALSRAALYKDMTPYCLSMKGSELLARMPRDCGLVVNPGYDKGFDISPAGLEKIRQEFGLG